MTLRKRVSVLAILALVASSLLLLTPAPAHADRCQPEELIFGAGNGPMDERDSAICAVMDYYVYPFICPDNQPKTLATCLQTINPDPNYRPPLIPPYSPDAFRIYCNAYVWTWQQLGQTATCQF